MTQIKPLQVKNKLQPAHLDKPHFSVDVKRGSETLNTSCPSALRSLIALMDMGAVLGGAACHYGGPAALAEIWSALHALIFDESKKQNKAWTELYHLVNDAGHCENGLYAIKANYNVAGVSFETLKTFRAMNSKLTGHGESHLFPEGVFLSNGPLGSGFPQSQGLAMAEKLAGSLRTTICTLSDGAAMEGEAKEALAAIPGLAAKNLLAPYVLIISDNNTKLSGRVDKDSYSLQPTFNSLETLGWKVFKLEQGNHLQSCIDVLDQAMQWAIKNPQQPAVVWAKTVKGIGTEKTVQSSTGAHGFPCKNVAELKDFVKEIYKKEWPTLFKDWVAELEKWELEIKSRAGVDSGEKIQKGIAKSLIKAAQKGLPVVSITSDLPGSTGVADFRKEFPQLSFDVGIAESNMISSAVGFSKLGFIPVVDTFAQFGVTKGALPLTMASLSQAPVIAIFSHTGFQDAADGASHQGLTYMSMLGSIPYMDLYSLSCSEEAESILDQVITQFQNDIENGRTPHSSILFLGRENFPKSYKVNNNESYVIGEPQIVRTQLMGSKNVLIVTTGSLVGEAIKASESLDQKMIGSVVLNLNSLTKINLKTVKDLLEKCEGRLITVEDHQVNLGMGAWLSHQLSLSGESFFIRSLGVKGDFGQSAYTAQELYTKHGLDAHSIVTTALNLMK